MKKKVLLFARSFLAQYYSEIKSDVIEPIFVTLTHEEKVFLESKGWKVYGCFEDEYDNLPIASFPGNYLRTSFQSDRFLHRFSYEKRLEILGKEISFWSNILDSTTPDFLVNETVAIEIAEVMAIEAQKRSIPFHTYLLGFIPGTFYWKPDPFSGRMQDMSTITVDEVLLSKAMNYVYDVVEKNARPFYVTGIKKNNITLKTVIHSRMLYKLAQKKQRKMESTVSFKYEDYSIFNKLAYDLYKSIYSCKAKYDSMDTLKDKNIVFLPLHMEPEAILNYFVDENYDQAMLINQVLSCLKNNQYLVVKEHPQQQGVLLTPKYQEIKKRNSNIIYLPSYELSFPIIKQSDAIITLTSTVAWEGLILGKPAFVIGRIFFDQCSGAIRIESFRQLKKEIQKDHYFVPNRSAVIEYVAKMISQFHSGCPTPCYKERSTIAEFTKEIERL